MVDIALVLAGIKTLSEERKEELKVRFETGSLSTQDREELEEHVLKAMAAVSQENAFAKKALNK